MANGKIRFGKQSGGQLALVIPDGVANTEVTFPESGVLAKTSDINTAGVELKTIATGTATFTATTNNINLTGIGVGLEIGDVIQISGAEDTKNNSEFTVEVITDANSIIVNQAHSNKGTTKNVAARVSDTGVTVKLLSKWYNAPIGLGRDWVNVTDSRALSTLYTNSTGRPIEVTASFISMNIPANLRAEISSVAIAYGGGTIRTAGDICSICVIVPQGLTYSLVGIGDTWSNSIWSELR